MVTDVSKRMGFGGPPPSTASGARPSSMSRNLSPPKQRYDVGSSGSLGGNKERSSPSLPDSSFTGMASGSRSLSAGPGGRKMSVDRSQSVEPMVRGPQLGMQVIPEEDDDDGGGPGQISDDMVGATALITLARDLLLASSDLERVLVLAKEGAARVLDSEAAELFLVDAAHGELLRSLQTRAKSIPIGTGILGRVAETRQVVVTGELQAHELYHSAADHHNLDVSSALVVPVLSPEDATQVVGVLRMVNSAHGGYSPSDVASAHIVAGLVAPAIQTALRFRSKSNSQAALASLLEISKALSMELNKTELIARVMELTSALLDSDRCAFFELDDDGRHLRSVHADKMAREICIPSNVGIAGRVCTTGLLMNIPDVYQHPDFNSAVDQATGYRTRSILAAPVGNESDEILGVIEMINKKDGSVFSKDDEKLLTTLASIIGVHLQKTKYASQLVYHTRLSQTIMELSLKMSDKNRGVTSFLEETIDAARDISDADRASLFFVDKNNQRLYSLVAQGAGKPISFPMDAGIAGHVARSGQLVNCPDVYADPRFNPAIDMDMSYRTSSLLCLPVFNGSGETIGVVQVMNKRSGGGFTKVDEGAVSAIVVFIGCAVTKLYSSWLERVGTTVFLDVKLGTPSPGYFSLEAAGPIADNSVDVVADWQAGRIRDPAYVQGLEVIDSLRFNPFTAQGDSQLLLVMDLVQKWDLFQRLSVDPVIVFRFLRALRPCYHDVPYHCFYHAIDTCATGHAFIANSDFARSLFTDVEVFAYLIGAVCHDLGHPGTNNAFQVAAKTGVAIIYNDKAVLESYHASRAFSLLMQPEFNFVETMAPKEVADFRRIMIELILATDMARHFEIVGKVKAKLEKSEPFDAGKPEDRLMIQQMLIKAADIGNVIKPWTVSNLWADRLLEEFFQQGDKEAAAGLPVTPFMDRTKVVRSKSQIGFISFMCVPLYSTLALAVPELEGVHKELLSNLESWKKEEAEGR